MARGMKPINVVLNDHVVLACLQACLNQVRHRRGQVIEFLVPCTRMPFTTVRRSATRRWTTGTAALASHFPRQSVRFAYWPPTKPSCSTLSRRPFRRIAGRAIL